MSDELTPLHLAALFNRRNAAELLLAEGAEVEIGDESGNTALHMATFLGHTEVVTVLLAAGADSAVRNRLGFSSRDLVAIEWSSGLEDYYRHTDVAKILIDAGADIELRNNSKGTALHQASFFCRPEIVELLLNVGADASKTNGRGLTPLDSVTIEIDAELIGIYRYVYESLNLELEIDDVIRTRRQIAELLNAHYQKPSAKTDTSKVTKPRESN